MGGQAVQAADTPKLAMKTQQAHTASENGTAGTVAALLASSIRENPN